MLIRWMAAQVYNERKVVIFLANTVALVHQQSAFIKGQTALEVRGYSGMSQDISGCRVDSWNISQWKLEFSTAEVLVMTRKDMTSDLGRTH